MKSIYKYTVLLVILFSFACEREYINPNKPSEESVYSSVDGFLSVCTGLKTHYSTYSLRHVVYVSGITTREIGTTSTYQTPMDLTYGGQSLTNINTGVGRLWAGLLKDKGQAEDLIKNIDNIEIKDETKNGILALANYFKALTICNLYQSFEQFPLTNSENGDAAFSSGKDGIDEAIKLLKEAKQKANAGISDEVSSILSKFDLSANIDALLSRLYLYNGQFAECITISENIDLSLKSVFIYDNENYNPVYSFAIDGSAYLLPKENFGLKGDYIPNEEDARYGFYLTKPDTAELAELGGVKLKQIKGFFTTFESEIPVYLPGEILLNTAEAYARSNKPEKAAEKLNVLMTKTDDVYGLNAALPDQTDYLKSLSKDKLLEEIYKQRCVELFFTGQRLVDSRRFHPNLQFNKASDLVSERNRNYYPYPQEERDNNPNCPTDPKI